MHLDQSLPNRGSIYSCIQSLPSPVLPRPTSKAEQTECDADRLRSMTAGIRKREGTLCQLFDMRRAGRTGWGRGEGGRGQNLDSHCVREFRRPESRLKQWQNNKFGQVDHHRVMFTYHHTKHERSLSHHGSITSLSLSFRRSGEQGSGAAPAPVDQY